MALSRGGEQFTLRVQSLKHLPCNLSFDGKNRPRPVDESVATLCAKMCYSSWLLSHKSNLSGEYLLRGHDAPPLLLGPLAQRGAGHLGLGRQLRELPRLGVQPVLWKGEIVTFDIHRLVASVETYISMYRAELKGGPQVS